MKTVFVVDDDAMMRLMSKSTLEKAGFNVVEIENAELALLLLDKQNPDAVLLDVGLPGIDGFTACEQIRRLPYKEFLPIMMLTGLGDIDSINHAYEVGATDFATKPMNWSTLAHRLLYIIRSNSALVELNKSQQRLQNAKKIAQIADWEYDRQQDTISWSDELYNLLGISPGTKVRNHREILSYIDGNDAELVETAIDNLFNENRPYDIEYSLRPKSGELIYVHEKANVLLDNQQTPISYIGTIQDVTKRKLIEEQVRQLAYYDNLTGLSNRILFNEHLSAAIKRSERANHRLAVLFIDLDNFKKINDSLGHEAGDVLLNEIGRRLQNSLRGSDVISRSVADNSQQIARFGGDEFMVLLSDNVNEKVVGIIADRILTQLAAPLSLEGHEVAVSGSIGVAFFPENGLDGKTLLKNADIAMYQAKNRGKNNVHFFESLPSSAPQEPRTK